MQRAGSSTHVASSELTNPVPWTALPRAGQSEGYFLAARVTGDWLRVASAPGGPGMAAVVWRHIWEGGVSKFGEGDTAVDGEPQELSRLVDARLERQLDDVAMNSGIAPFIRPDWVRMSTAAFGPTEQLRVMTVERSDELNGILPPLRACCALCCLMNSEKPIFPRTGDNPVALLRSPICHTVIVIGRVACR